MKKLKSTWRKIQCLLDFHEWDKEADIIGEIQACQWCGHTERLDDIEMGAQGEQFLLFTTVPSIKKACR